MTTATTNTAEAARALKARHRAMWAAGDYPAGANELPRESDVLKTIQITPRK